MSSTPPFARLVLARPVVPLLVGYGGVCALLALLVSIQSGPVAGVTSGLANVVIFLPAVGITWILGQLVARRAPEGQAWWMTRAQGYVVGFIAVVSVALFPIASVVPQLRQEADAAGADGTELVAALVAVLAVVNAIPLLVALGLEAWARRKAPPVSRPRAS